MFSKSGRIISTVVGTVGVLILAAIAGWAILNRQYVIDVYQAFTYKPTSDAAALIDDIAFSPRGRLLAQASHLEVNTASDFNQNCKQQEEGSAILGCYTSGRIYVYNVDNVELNGIKEVTAAHEMLHAAWVRLSVSEQTRLSELLEAEYQAQADDALKEKMDYYARTEPGEKYNELHSIIATEFVTVSDELESYFAHYFTDRQQVVALHKTYQAVFDKLEAQADALYTELSTMAKQIEAMRANYTSESTALNAAITSFNARANNGGFASTEEFNTARSALLARISSVDALYDELEAAIRTYNTKYDEYQDLAVQQRDLQSSIDSNDLAPAPSL